MLTFWKAKTYRGGPLFCTCTFLVRDDDQSLFCEVLANAGKAGMAFIGFKSLASGAKHIVLQDITCIPPVFQIESRGGLTAYKIGEDVCVLNSFRGSL